MCQACQNEPLCQKCANAVTTETDETKELSRKVGITVKVFTSCLADTRIHNLDTAREFCPILKKLGE